MTADLAIELLVIGVATYFVIRMLRILTRLAGRRIRARQGRRR